MTTQQAARRADRSLPEPRQENSAAQVPVTQVVLRRWWIVVLFTLVGVGVALVVSQDGERYEARASLLFSPPVTASILGEQRISVDADRTGATRTELLGLDQQVRRAARALDLPAETVDEAVEIDAPKDADIAAVVATTGDPALSARIANSYAREFIASRRRVAQVQIRAGIESLTAQRAALPPGRDLAYRAVLRERISALRTALPLQTGDAELVQRAVPPAQALPTNLARNLILGALAGFVLGLAVASSSARSDRRLRSALELEDLFGVPVLAEIPRTRSLRSEARLAAPAAGTGEILETFRGLRAGLRASGRPLRVLLVVSPESGDGKSTVAHSLALAMAAMGDRVVLVDADLRKDAEQPGQGGGLHQVLTGGDLDSALREQAVGTDPVEHAPRSLTLLPSGPPTGQTAEMLESQRAKDVFDELESRFDTVIIDTAALGNFSDAMALIPRASVVLVVCALGQTRRQTARTVRRDLGLAGAPLVGVAANFARRRGRNGYDGYYS